MAPKAAAPPSPATTVLASPTLTPTEEGCSPTQVESTPTLGSPTQVVSTPTLVVGNPPVGGGASELGSRSRSRSPVEAAQQAAAGGEPGQGDAPPVQAHPWPEEQDRFGFLPHAREEEARTTRALSCVASRPRASSSSAGEPRVTQTRYGLREAGPPAHLRWQDMPRAGAASAGGAFALAREMASGFLQATGVRPRVDCSRIQRCSHDIEGDLGYVRLAVSSLCPLPSDAFYIGACVREPGDRFWCVGSEREGPGDSVAHSSRWDWLGVLMTAPAAHIADRERAGIELYLGPSAPLADRPIRNVDSAPSGYSRSGERAFLYLCHGSAARADNASLGGLVRANRVRGRGGRLMLCPPPHKKIKKLQIDQRQTLNSLPVISYKTRNLQSLRYTYKVTTRSSGSCNRNSLQVCPGATLHAPFCAPERARLTHPNPPLIRPKCLNAWSTHLQ